MPVHCCCGRSLSTIQAHTMPWCEFRLSFSAALCSSKTFWTFKLHTQLLIRIKIFHWLIVKNENLIQTWDCARDGSVLCEVIVGHPSSTKAAHDLGELLQVASPPGEQILPFHPLLCLSDNEFLSPCIDILITEPEWGRLDHQQPANWECQKQRECGCRRAQEINLFSCCGFRVLCWCHSSLYRCCFKLTGKIFPFSDPWSLLSTW